MEAMTYNIVSTEQTMSANRFLKHLLFFVIGFAITLPYFYNAQAFRSWMIHDVYGTYEAAKDPIGLVNLVMVVIFIIGLRSLALISSSPSAWRVDAGDMRNIQSMVDYRDSRLKGMNNEDGAVLMRETQVLDAMNGRYPQGSEAGRVAEYMNSRLGGMTYEQGLNWLKNPAKK